MSNLSGQMRTIADNCGQMGTNEDKRGQRLISPLHLWLKHDGKAERARLQDHVKPKQKKFMSTTNNQTELSGMLGGIVSVRKVGGRVVVTNRPKRKLSNPTDKQVAIQEKFQEAAQYASRQIAVEESRAMYAAGITTRKRNAYIVAVSDYLSAPKLRSIDTIDYHGAVGDPIVVLAKDDFMVTKVKIVITNAAGAIIEQGDAGPDAMKADHWGYKATAANPTLTGTKIQAIAYDRPGNVGTAELVL
jgi:hypothetical protein